MPIPREAFHSLAIAQPCLKITIQPRLQDAQLFRQANNHLNRQRRNFRCNALDQLSGELKRMLDASG
jgi:hypothetical protein